MSVQKLEVIKDNVELIVKLNTNYYKKLKGFFFKLMNDQPDQVKSLTKILDNADDITKEEAMISVLIHLINEMELYAKEHNLLEEQEIDVKDLFES
jgi:hypothetical protein